MKTYLYMGARKLRSSKCLLSLIKRLLSRDTKDKSSLITSSSSCCYTEPSIPSPMNAFTRIQEI